jgi:hypothetical protein
MDVGDTDVVRCDDGVQRAYEVQYTMLRGIVLRRPWDALPGSCTGSISQCLWDDKGAKLGYVPIEPIIMIAFQESGVRFRLT